MIIKSEQRRYNRIRKKLSKTRVGLPNKVVFWYDKGTVICLPKERKWIVKIENKKPIIHYTYKTFRNDVTKYRAKCLLKMALINVLRDDSAVPPKETK